MDAAGFTYAKSSQAMTRKRGDPAFWISFHSSQHNIAGELFALRIHAVVSSPAPKN